MAIAILDRVPLHYLMLVIILLFPFRCTTADATTVECHPSERSSLLDLIHDVSFNLNGRPLVSWKPDSNCCDWEGVTCDPKSGHVIVLDLSERYIHGKLSSSLFNLTYLQTLRLSGNYFEGTFPQVGFENLTQLTDLHLYFTGLSGQIPIGISRLTNLIYLAIATEVDHNLTLWNPSFRTLVGNLSNLRELDLNNIDMSSNLDWGSALSMSMPHLQALSLNSCNLTGLLPTDILTSHKNLTSLDLSWNPVLSGNLPDFPNDSALQELSICNTNLSGMIPSSIGNLFRLYFLNLSSNNFTGPIPISLLNLSALNVLELSHNQLSGELKEFSNPSLSLTILLLGNNQLQGQIPRSFLKLSALAILDLSSNKFGGGVPEWIWRLDNIQLLNLSVNKFTHLEGPFNLSMNHHYGCLDLHSNLIQGPILLPWLSVEYLDYSDNSISSIIPSNISSYLLNTTDVLLGSNNLSGEIPTSICKAQYLEVLDLSGNSLTGSIPSCLFDSKSLLVLNLKGNQLQGTIPKYFSQECMLEALILSDNHLKGPISQNLLNCGSLKILDLGNNSIVESFPSWLGNMVNIFVLILRGNALHGPVNVTESLEAGNVFSNLQIFDLSSNHFNGNLPSICFDNLKTMTTSVTINETRDIADGNHYNYEVLVINDGYIFTFKRILMISYTFVDFSNNNFEGDIPELIGKLQGLHMLNLSYNALTGKIPSVIGKMRQLDKLDLSANHLSGEIPQELTSLTFLGFLNLSNNNLTGRIPQGNQFDTFTNTSYLENQGLCGSPLTKQCDNGSPSKISPTSPTTSNHSSSQLYIIVLALLIGLGFGMGFAVVFMLQNVQLKFWKRRTIANI